MIEKDKWYSLTEVSKGLLPMLQSKFVLKKWCESGKLRAVIIGKGKGRRIQLKGQWLIEFIAKWEAGDFNN